MDNLEWHTGAKAYLDKVCFGEWVQQGRSIPTKRNRHFRYCPSEYVRDLIDALNRNDEEAFKAIKMYRQSGR